MRTGSKQVIYFGCAFLTLLASGCATPPPLDDAKLNEVRLATLEDKRKKASAESEYQRAIFGGATVPDQGKVVVFGKDDYDAYLAYVRAHETSLALDSIIRQTKWPWPVLYISFFTKQRLVEYESGTEPDAVVYSCDEADINNIGNSAPGRLLWHGHIVADWVAPQIDAASNSGAEPQEFEVIFPYMLSKRRQIESGVIEVELMMPEGDLCLAVRRIGYPTFYGRPLRIPGQMVRNVLRVVPLKMRSNVTK
ncbi:MAG: hypothetical protein E6Q98_07270 [Rhodospirillaceae bacterium]|nr:MAG: hypothetical protein E6Q98_07270 [Rhodospirillaceae bacterium]